MVKVVLSALYDAQSQITLARVERALRDVVPDWVDDADVPAILVAEIAETIELFRRLHHCGAISITATNGPGDADELAAATRRPEKSTITLTPLGVYGAREYLLGTGCDAPVTAD